MAASSLPLSCAEHGSTTEPLEFELDLGLHAALLEREFPDVFELFYKVGIHPTRPSATPSLYPSRMVVPSRPNIGWHSIAVALCARAMATLLQNHPGAPGVDLRDVTRRALLHDIGKPFELMRRDLLRDVSAVYSDKAYSDVYKLLLNVGATEEEALTVVTSGVDAGHLSTRRFLYIDRDGTLRLIAGNVSGKIVHVADSMVVTTIPTATSQSRTHICTPSSRILGAHSKQRYPWLWEIGLALDGDKEIIEVPDIRADVPGCSIIGSYATVLAWTASAICTEFSEDMGALTHGAAANQDEVNGEVFVTSAVVDHLRKPGELPVAV